MKILIVCERLAARDDEGIRNVARQLLIRLSERHEVRALTRGYWPGQEDVLHVPMNRFFLNAALLRAAREFQPNVTLYVPWTSGTPPTFWRARLMQAATGTPVAIYLSQPYELIGWQKFVIRRLLPPLVVAMSDNVVRQLAQLGADLGVSIGSRRRRPEANVMGLWPKSGRLNRQKSWKLPLPPTCRQPAPRPPSGKAI